MLRPIYFKHNPFIFASIIIRHLVGDAVIFIYCVVSIIASVSRNIIVITKVLLIANKVSYTTTNTQATSTIIANAG